MEKHNVMTIDLDISNETMNSLSINNKMETICELLPYTMFVIADMLDDYDECINRHPELLTDDKSKNKTSFKSVYNMLNYLYLDLDNVWGIVEDNNKKICKQMGIIRRKLAEDVNE